MARTTKPLSDTEAKHAKPKDKVYSLNDGLGLQLRIKPNGGKFWMLDYYKPHTKKRTSLSFGRYPEVSLLEARQQREAARRLLASNIDPKEHRDEQAKLNESTHKNTLIGVASDWFKVKQTKVTPAYGEDIWRSLENHIFPTLGDLPIHKVSAVASIGCLNPLAAKGSLESVKRICQRLNEVMVYAVNTGSLDHNRLAGINQAFKSPAKRNLPTITPDQLPDLLHKVAMASIKMTTRCLIEWQLHTLTRPGEAAGTKWDEIDLNAKLWTIPAERMKAKRLHIVPLTDQALAILNVMSDISQNNDYVFPSDRAPQKPTNSSTANVALKRMGFHNELVAHGLRSLASTTLNEQGFDSDLIETALAHRGQNEVRNAYNRALYIDRRIPMMEWWSEHIAKASIGSRSVIAKGQFDL